MSSFPTSKAPGDHAVACDSGSVTCILQSPEAQRHWARDGIYGLGESWMNGEWTVDHLDDFLCQIMSGPIPKISWLSWVRLLGAAAKTRFVDQQAGKGAFRIGEAHYDLGNELFELMLDSSMSYTCGYWKDATDLEEAQRHKLDVLCRKLELEPGMQVLDVGCGWGNFAHHAATHYGVEVTGLTVSAEQAEYAKNRCAALPVNILLQDYRTFDGHFDRIVSIEMIEAVGRRNLPRWYRDIDRWLRPGGCFALQAIVGETISRTSDRRLDQYILWLVRHIFPDGCLPRVQELSARGTSMRIDSWERISGDYDRTLLAWYERFEQGWNTISDRYSERFRRCWQFYLLGCAAAFRSGLVDVNQIVYRKSSSQGVRP